MIKGSDKISCLYDFITLWWFPEYDKDKLIQEGKCIQKTVYIENGDAMPTFNELLELAKANGYIKGTLYLMTNGDMRGRIYRYNAYHNDPRWFEWGETRGNSQ